MGRRALSLIKHWVLRLACFACLIAVLSTASLSQADDGFEERFSLAKDQSKALRRLFTGQSDTEDLVWLSEIAVEPVLLRLRLGCGVAYERNSEAVAHIVWVFFKDLYDRIDLRLARLLADSLSLEELQNVEIADNPAKSVRDVIGEKRFEIFREDWQVAIKTLEEDNDRRAKGEFRVELNKIDPCLGGKATSITRS